jgi:Kef-type K+ transport system membrane component KefB
VQAASQLQTEGVLASALLQFIVIVLVARFANRVMRRLGQPGVVGEILAGLLLGPSLLGALMPGLSNALFHGPAGGAVQVISQVGLILLMFQIGSDFHFSHLAQRDYRSTVAAVALASVGVPLAVGLLLGWLTAPILAPGVSELPYCLFFAVAMAITAVPVLGRILREFDLTRTPVGVIAISAAAVNDLIGWILLGIVSAVATVLYSPAATLAQVGGIAAFGALLWGLGRPFAAWLVRRFPLEQGRLPNSLMAIVLGMLFAAGYCTFELGIFAIFGGFAVGLLFYPHRQFVLAWQQQVGQFVLVFFLPIFFTYTGLRTDVFGLVSVSDWGWCAAILVVACAAKIIPVFLAARGAGRSPQDALVCGVLMNTRALMELVVLNIGLDLGFIPQKVFTMLVIMAVLTTLMASPLLRWAYQRNGQSLVAVVDA